MNANPAPAPGLVLELGPSHPMTGQAAAFRVHLEGELITRVEVEPGLGHRGFEKACEQVDLRACLAWTEHLHAGSISQASLPFCLAVERLLEIEVPVRARWLRVLVAELSRIDDHLTRLGRTFHSLGAGGSLAFGARERCRGMLEALCGARVSLHYVTIGGVRRDLPAGWCSHAAEAVAEIRHCVHELDARSLGDEILRDRLADVAVLTADAAKAWGVTGPMLRASGVPADLRHGPSLLPYDELDFEVPVGRVGDNLDRLRICVEEIEQSLRIAEQCMVRLEAEEAVGLLGARLPEPLLLPRGDAYAAVESANGVLGFYVRGDGGERPARVHCRAPSFAHLAALPLLMQGAPLAELRPTLDLANVIAAECDR